MVASSVIGAALLAASAPTVDLRAPVLVSRAASADFVPTNGASFVTDVSADGNTALIISSATNLSPGATGRMFVYRRTLDRIENVPSPIYHSVALSSNGEWVVYSHSGGISLHQISTGIATLLNVSNGTLTQPINIVEISSDGRYIAFGSAASNIRTVQPYPPGSGDQVYLLDRNTSQIRLVSTTSSGAVVPNANSGQMVVSRDGRRVAFESAVNGLVPDDTNGVVDVYLKDTTSGVLRRISRHSNGSQLPMESRLFGSGAADADLNSILFGTSANAAAADANGIWDTYRFSVPADAVELLTHGVGGLAVGGQATISDNGEFVGISTTGRLAEGVLFTTGASNAYRRSLTNAAVVPVSVNFDGTQLTGCSGAGSVVVSNTDVAYFSSRAALDASDGNNLEDVFLRSTNSAGSTSVTSRIGGAVAFAANRGSEIGWHVPSLSDDGRWIAYTSRASNLVQGDGTVDFEAFLHDAHTGTTMRIDPGQGADVFSARPQLSGTGRYVAYEKRVNGRTQVYWQDRQTGIRTLVSALNGVPGNGDSLGPSISQDGGWVSFLSNASSLRPDLPGNSAFHVYLWRVSDGQLQRISPNTASVQVIYPSPQLHGNGRFVFYVSRGRLVPGDSTSRNGLFMFDRIAGTTELINIGSSGTEPVGDFFFVAGVSGDGRRVIFELNQAGSGTLMQRDRLHQSLTTLYAGGLTIQSSRLLDDDSTVWLNAFGRTRRLDLASGQWTDWEWTGSHTGFGINRSGSHLAVATQFVLTPEDQNNNLVDVYLFGPPGPRIFSNGFE